MKFDWTAREKEQFYRKAERQLKEYGIDFIQVDRDQFGVKGWRSEAKTIEAAVITLTPYPYRRLTKAQERALRKMENWQCTDKKASARDCIEGQTFMHSRLIIRRLRERKRRDESEICSNNSILKDGRVKPGGM
jgi:hypothetical protein